MALHRSVVVTTVSQNGGTNRVMPGSSEKCSTSPARGRIPRRRFRRPALQRRYQARQIEIQLSFPKASGINLFVLQ